MLRKFPFPHVRLHSMTAGRLGGVAMYRLTDAIIAPHAAVPVRVCVRHRVPQQVSSHKIFPHASPQYPSNLLKPAALLGHDAAPMFPVMSCLQLVTRIGKVSGKVSAHLSAISPSSLAFSRHPRVVILAILLQRPVGCEPNCGISALIVVSNDLSLKASRKLCRRLVETTGQFHPNFADGLTNM